MAVLVLAASLTLSPIGQQALPARGCAAFLWSATRPDGPVGPVAMASVEPATLRLRLDGTPVELAGTGRRGDAGLGLAASSDYRGGGLSATLDLTVATSAGLRDGATVPSATLRLRRDGGDELVVPLAGLVGCRPAA